MHLVSNEPGGTENHALENTKKWVIPCKLSQPLNPSSQIFLKLISRQNISCWFQQTKFFWNWL